MRSLILLALTPALALPIVACSKAEDPIATSDAGFVGRDDSQDDDAGPGDPGTTDPTPTDPDAGADGGSCTGKIVINEFMPAGTAANDEFLELYNPSACDVTLDGFKLLYKSSTGMPSNGSPLHTFPTGTTIKGHGYYVLATLQHMGTKDATFNGGGVTVNGGLSNEGQIAIFDGSANKLDSVGYGAATGDYVEKSPAPKAPATASIARKADGVDTDDNSKDFDWYTNPTPGAKNGF
jgi:hypothetical protein